MHTQPLTTWPLGMRFQQGILVLSKYWAWAMCLHTPALLALLLASAPPHTHTQAHILEWQLLPLQNHIRHPQEAAISMPAGSDSE